ncbi:hypothetical protein [Streptomyces triticirhizae]|uniref:XRE family transcriptional regulator n=1 Tax=Streptomyces triticirhizae TaxID=2483353 RepID=A0A3M2M6S8_9ACTN|nr:hypothetical protein [Streptomyces triticirhizae]RMI45222.1 hypothetical protein EBN88_03570 [Streptomyces triticirhizae]
MSEAARETARFAALAEQSNVGPHTLDQLQADIRRVVTTYPSRPIEPLFHEVRELRDRAFNLLEGRQAPHHTRDLYLAAGLLCGVLANASFDLNRYHEAETQARAAFLCGELAGHNGLRAWLRGLQSLIAYWDGRPRDAVQLAHAGMEFVPENGTAHIRLASISARAWGQLGHRTEALAALRQADEHRERLTPDIEHDDPGGMMSFPLAKQHLYAGTTHLWLRDPTSLTHAKEAANQAIQLYQADPPERRRLGELALARVDLAQVHLATGDLDAAADQGHTVLGLAATRRTESIDKGLDRLARHLNEGPAATSPTAIGLREAITHHRARALPPGETT